MEANVEGLMTSLFSQFVESLIATWGINGMEDHAML